MNDSGTFVIYLEKTELSSLDNLLALMESASDASLTQRFAFMMGPARHLRKQLISALDHPAVLMPSGEVRITLNLSSNQIEILSHFIRKVRLSDLTSAIGSDNAATEASIGLWKLADAARPITLEF